MASMMRKASWPLVSKSMTLTMLGCLSMAPVRASARPGMLPSGELSGMGMRLMATRLWMRVSQQI